MNDELRRLDDTRIGTLDQKVSDLDRKVTEIRDMLISEPEASPLGRTLLKRADTNAENIRSIAQHNRATIEELDGRVDSLESWRDEAKGAYNAARIIQVLLAVIVGILTLYNLGQVAGG